MNGRINYVIHRWVLMNGEIPPTSLYERGRDVKSIPYSGTRSASRGMTSSASRRVDFSQPSWFSN